MRLTKTQTNLGIRLVWLEYSLCAKWVAKDPGFFMQTAKTDRLDGCPGWSESLSGFAMQRLNYYYKDKYHNVLSLWINILNAKRNAHNFRFDFCRTATLQIKFIYSREYTWHPSTNTLNVLRVQVSLKAQFQLIENQWKLLWELSFLSEYTRFFLKWGSDVSAFKILLVFYLLARGLKWQPFEVVQF